MSEFSHDDQDTTIEDMKQQISDLVSVNRVLKGHIIALESRVTAVERRAARSLDLIDQMSEKVRGRPHRPGRVMDRAEYAAHLRIAEIAQTYADKYGVTLERMRAHDRRSAFHQPRREAWAECHSKGYSSVMIGRFFGGRDHTSILHGIKRLEEDAKREMQKLRRPCRDARG